MNERVPSTVVYLILLSLLAPLCFSRLVMDPPLVRRVCAGESVILRCTQTETFPINANWQLGETKVSRTRRHYSFRTIHIFAITNVSFADSGKYDYEVIDGNTGHLLESTISSISLTVENCASDDQSSTTVTYSAFSNDTSMVFPENPFTIFSSSNYNDTSEECYPCKQCPLYIAGAVFIVFVIIVVVAICLLWFCPHVVKKAAMRFGMMKIKCWIRRNYRDYINYIDVSHEEISGTLRIVVQHEEVARMLTTELQNKKWSNDFWAITSFRETAKPRGCMAVRQSQAVDSKPTLRAGSLVVSKQTMSIIAGTVSIPGGHPYALMVGHATEEGAICGDINGEVFGKCQLVVKETVTSSGNAITVDLALVKVDAEVHVDNVIEVEGKMRQLTIGKGTICEGTCVYIMDRTGTCYHGVLSQVGKRIGQLHGAFAITDSSGKSRVLQGSNSGALVISLSEVDGTAIALGVVIGCCEEFVDGVVTTMDIAMHLWEALQACACNETFRELFNGDVRDIDFSKSPKLDEDHMIRLQEDTAEFDYQNHTIINSKYADGFDWRQLLASALRLNSSYPPNGMKGNNSMLDGITVEHSKQSHHLNYNIMNIIRSECDLEEESCSE